MSELPYRNKITGRGIPIRENDIDTDRIIPARYMKVVTFEGIGKYAFYDARFDESGKEMEHPFNDPRFKGGSVLLVNRNFGCGSSREHAPQALMRYGVSALVGESFAEIFAGNCTVLGIPTATVSHDDVTALQDLVEKDPSLEITVDLDAKEVRAGGKTFPITMKETYRKALATGLWDSTAELLLNKSLIEAKAQNLPYIAGF